MTDDNRTLASVVYKDIPGFPGYRVGDDGSAWSCRTSQGSIKPDRWKVLKPLKDKDGYMHFGLCRDKKVHRRSAHRLVLEAFVGPRPAGQECRHLNGIRDDNRLANICWGTVVENKADMVVHGTAFRGEHHPQAKLSEAQVLGIRAMRADGYTRAAIAARYGTNKGNVKNILQRRTWKHV